MQVESFRIIAEDSLTYEKLLTSSWRENMCAEMLGGIEFGGTKIAPAIGYTRRKICERGLSHDSARVCFGQR